MTLIKTRLIYLGVLPFLIFTYFALANLSLLGVNANELFIAYSVIILNFVLGTLWHTTASWAKISISVWTNIFSLFSFVLLFCQQSVAIAGLIGCFIFAYFIELKGVSLVKNEDLRHYLNTRLYITCVVVLCHLILLLPIAFSRFSPF